MTRTTRATTTRPGILTRLRARAAPRRAPRTTRSVHTRPGGTTTTTTKTVKTTHHGGPVGATHHRRHASLGDKISGALLRLRGSLTRRPGKKAAGTRRMHGTDGRRARRARRFFHLSKSISPSPDLPEPMLSKKPSVVAADAALTTAVDLVTQIQTLQSRVVEVEKALATKTSELALMIDERDKWQHRAESIRSLEQERVDPHAPQTTDLDQKASDSESNNDITPTNELEAKDAEAVKEVSEEANVEEIPEETTIKEVPEETTIKEVPEETKETQEVVIEDEIPIVTDIVQPLYSQSDASSQAEQFEKNAAVENEHETEDTAAEDQQTIPQGTEPEDLAPPVNEIRDLLSEDRVPIIISEKPIDDVQDTTAEEQDQTISQDITEDPALPPSSTLPEEQPTSSSPTAEKDNTVVGDEKEKSTEDNVSPEYLPIIE